MCELSGLKGARQFREGWWRFARCGAFFPGSILTAAIPSHGGGPDDRAVPQHRRDRRLRYHAGLLSGKW